ncbi:MAG: sugar phosphate isomerase/epimerase [Chloroflexi bacterium]|nr:sugar phosphate isomerase/epimerase [Chloroflexota bacterium]
MQIGFVTLGMGREPLDAVLAAARAAGCEAMELNGRETVHHNLWAPPIDFESLQREVGASGVDATSLGGYCNFAATSDAALEEEVRQFLGYCDVAREMGIPVVRAFPGDVVEGHTLDELYPSIVAGFGAVVDEIADWGVRIGIENHGRLLNDGDRLYDLVREVDSPLLGITLDTGNFCWAGHPIDRAHRFLERLAPMAVSVHVKDGRFIDGEWTLFPAGRGDIDLPGVFAALQAVGYDGPVLSEYEGTADFLASTTESVAYLRGLRDGRGLR